MPVTSAFESAHQLQVMVVPTLGTQIGAAIVFILETLAVVEIVLVSNMVTPTKTQGILRTLHDWARAYRRQILVAMFTLVGLALVAQGVGGL
jgi:hypothetical protein